MLQLNQYYTEFEQSSSLINHMNSSSPKLALDLGCGVGSLLHAAKNRWANLKLIGVDIDPLNIIKANSSKIIQALLLDGFSLDLPDILEDKYGAIDLLVSNPPYYVTELDHNKRKILEKAGLDHCITRSTKKIPAELIFLAQNLRLLKNNGEIGIILPAGLISGERWKQLRLFLFKNYRVPKIIQLPKNCFKKTDAQTFIVLISQKEKADSNSTIEVLDIQKNHSYRIGLDEAVERADFQFYHEMHTSKDGGIKVSNQDFSIYRGSLSHKELKKLGCEYIHTTNLLKIPSQIYGGYAPLDIGNHAVKGDILVARVGTRCIGRVAVLQEGNLPLSDCVICIRPKDKMTRINIWEKLTSNKAISFFQNSAYGVSAKYLTHSLIVNFLTNKE